MCGEGDWYGGLWESSAGGCIGKVSAWEICFYVNVMDCAVSGWGAIEVAFIPLILVHKWDEI